MSIKFIGASVVRSDERRSDHRMLWVLFLTTVYLVSLIIATAMNVKVFGAQRYPQQPSIDAQRLASAETRLFKLEDGRVEVMSRLAVLDSLREDIKEQRKLWYSIAGTLVVNLIMTGLQIKSQRNRRQYTHSK